MRARGSCPGARALIARAEDVGTAVGIACGHAPARDLKGELWRYYGALPVGATASMQRDIIAGRPSELDAWNGAVSERPFVLLTQPSLFDVTRAPAGKHTAWAYCHVPHASDADMLPRIEAQIERESHAFFVTARLYDDGLIDPRDTRTVLGIALSAAHSAPVGGRRGFGVFRM